LSWADAVIQQVWEKGKLAPSNDPKVFRKDSCDAWIRRNLYGNRNSTYGWEIDHINPNGGDALSNLQPLQWENNVHKSDGKSGCKVTSSGTDNIYLIK
jgi:hypothetical protein